MKAYPLAMAQEGETVRIAQILDGRRLAMRLTEMGLNLGSEVTILQRIEGQMVVLRGQLRLALGAGMASRILVVPASDPAEDFRNDEGARP